MTADLLEGRIAELERRAQRLVLAGDDRGAGWGAWQNLLELRLMEERDYLNDLLSELIAQMQRDFRDEMKAAIDQAFAMRIRGTFDPKAKYNLGDVVAHDGASFIARRNDPGPLPGGGWQLFARQGSRGIAGSAGPRGPMGATITGWILDRENFRATPKMSDNSLGPTLELRALFEDGHSDAA